MANYDYDFNAQITSSACFGIIDNCVCPQDGYSTSKITQRKQKLAIFINIWQTLPKEFHMPLYSYVDK